MALRCKAIGSAASAEIDKSRQKSTEVGKYRQQINQSRQKSTKVISCQQKSALFQRESERRAGNARGSSAKTHVLEHKGLWRRCACFYRQVLLFQKEGMWRLLPEPWHKCATASSSTFLDTPTFQMGGNLWQNPEPNGVCCFRAKNSESR
jgi:hypothetical protein